MKANDPSELDRLRSRIESALRSERPRAEILPMLEQLLAGAGERAELHLYAHRQMAELLLQEEPWRAALHLRRVIRANAADDTTHALMGLCQALLGNFDSAVFHYERALALDADNAWYHHNLGHLLDVALSMPEQAAPHLRWAHESQPMEDEVTASLAHCLARLGDLQGAEALAAEAHDLAPEHESHASLLAWIQKGAPGGFLFSADGTFAGRGSSAESEARSASRKPSKEGARSESDTEADRNVLLALERGMLAGGAPDVLLARAKRVWRDYRACRRTARAGKPETHAAALEYAVSIMHGISGVTQAGVARRYGVSSTALANRYTDMRSALDLTVGDPRYLH